MARNDLKIDVSLVHTRPCWADGKKAIFHKFVDQDNIIISGTGEFRSSVMQTYALIEYEDGTVKLVGLKDIKFLDNNIKEMYYG